MKEISRFMSERVKATGSLSIVDRYVTDQKGIDVLLLTLDAERFLEKSLLSLYAEIPVARLLVCDGGSTDRTVPILRAFPRVELHIRPDIRTTGKAVEFLLSKAETEWIMFTDGDLTFPKGWYDEMCKYRSSYDAFDSKRIHAFEFFREDPVTTAQDQRPVMTSPQMGRRKALQNFHVDDDYLWRIVDIASRQTVEKNNYRYGKVTTTFHFHHTTEESKYASDPSKVASRIVFQEPREIVINEENWRKRIIDNIRAYVKYTDPNLIYVKMDRGIDIVLPLLERSWVLEHGPAWISRYDEAVKEARRENRVWRRLLKVLKKLISIHVRALRNARTYWSKTSTILRSTGFNPRRDDCPNANRRDGSEPWLPKASGVSEQSD
jgi:glycosyltransferase involved in cell wall biosynthesis